ncbi:hypothetical protein, partial [Pseudoflavonifractor phocaeensis]|uniref:hypothetical protein n=1 Tax=Pseudoflavonifractor phocaeensis TaxID=1870988 RepID=UPI001F3760B9
RKGAGFARAGRRDGREKFPEAGNEPLRLKKKTAIISKQGRIPHGPPIRIKRKEREKRALRAPRSHAAVICIVWNVSQNEGI